MNAGHTEKVGGRVLSTTPCCLMLESWRFRRAEDVRGLMSK